MTQTARRARVVHAIPGRLRIRFEEDGPAPETAGLAAVRVAPGVLAIEEKPASRSVVVRYDPALTTQALVLVELEQAGITVMAPGETASSSPLVDVRAENAGGARDARGRFTRQSATAEPAADQERAKVGGRSELWELLIGPPPKLDRRFAESITLSLISLLAARRVGTALGGGTTLPAYFAIWFALRRLTGFGRRR